MLRLPTCDASSVQTGDMCDLTTDLAHGHAAAGVHGLDVGHELGADHHLVKYRHTAAHQPRVATLGHVTRDT